MIRRIVPVASDVARWVRDAATSLNALMDRVETPQSGDVRYNTDTPGLEYYDGSAWQPVP